MAAAAVEQRCCCRLRPPGPAAPLADGAAPRHAPGPQEVLALKEGEMVALQQQGAEVAALQHKLDEQTDEAARLQVGGL